MGDGDRDAIYLAAPAVALLVAVVTRFTLAAAWRSPSPAAAVTTVVAGTVAVVLVATDRESRRSSTW